MSGDPEVADHLVEMLDANRRTRWEQETSSMGFTRSSRKSWSLIRRLGSAQRPAVLRHSLVTPDAVAGHLLNVAKAPMRKETVRRVRDEWRQFLRGGTACDDFAPFSAE